MNNFFNINKHFNVKEWSPRFFFNFLILFVLLAIVYGSALNNSYAHHDDYYYFSFDVSDGYTAYHQFAFVNLIGRQLYGIFGFLMGFLISDMGDFTTIRLIGLLLLTLSCSLFLNYLSHLGVSKLHAFTSVILIAFLPGFQSGIFWASMAPLFVCLLLVIIAGISVQISLEQESLNLSLVVLSFFLLTSALFIHPAWAMVFFAPFAAFLLFKENKKMPAVVRATLINYAVFSFACISYFVLHKFVLLKLMFHTYPNLIEAYQNLGIYKFELSSNPMLKLTQLLTSEFYKVFGLWDIYQERWGANLLMIVCSLSFILFVKKSLSGRDSLNYKLLPFVAVIYMMTFVAALAPCILPQGGHSMFRVILPASVILSLGFSKSLVLITHYFLIRKTGRRGGVYFLHFFAFCLILGLGNVVHKNVKSSVENNLSEFYFVKSLIFNNVNQFGLPRHVHVVRDSGSIGFNGLPSLGDTMNANSTRSPHNVPWIIKAALVPLFEKADLLKIRPIRWEDFDMNHSVGSNEVIVTSSTTTPPPSSISSSTLLIDMRNNVMQNLRSWIIED